jgi:hypothetical protein
VQISRRVTLGVVAASAVSLLAVTGVSAAATPPINGTVNGFEFGELASDTVGAAGCGTNAAGEPAIHVSRADLVAVSSERGVGSGTDTWRGPATAPACGLEYRGQPNAIVPNVALAGGDTDLAIASERNSAGTYTIYVASLNLASVAVAHSTDDGATWSNVPLVFGVPVDDREWIAAYGANTSLLTYHDVATNNINVLRSDDGGATYTQIARAIPATDYKALLNQHGNLAIDRRTTAGAAAGQFWAYQSFVAPSTKPSLLSFLPVVGTATLNEAFMSVSKDGGHTWSVRPIPCSVSAHSLSNQFPNVSVAPDGTVWSSWSDGQNVFTAVSRDHGSSWSCSPAVSTNTAQAIFPWMVATSAGVDLVYYGTTTPESSADTPTWSVYFAQNLPSTATGWGTPTQLMPVHVGTVCGQGVECTSGRQLLDDFGVDTDQEGFAHIAYSHDAPDLGGATTFTGYARQVGGTPVGYPN